MAKKKNTILVVDDEPQFLKMLMIGLDAGSYSLEGCQTGKEGLRLFLTLRPALVLLDVNLPDISGYEVITSIREWSQVPIIMLSARGQDQDIVKALDLGADDYVTKPFNLKVLEARINANLRQSATREAGEPELVNGPLRMDLVRHEVYIGQQAVSFTPKEYTLLRHLLVNRGKMLTHKELLKQVWGPTHGEDVQYLRVFISQIREKIDAILPLPDLIATEPGIGYRMELLPQHSPAARNGNGSVA